MKFQIYFPVVTHSNGWKNGIRLEDIPTKMEYGLSQLLYILYHFVQQTYFSNYIKLNNINDIIKQIIKQRTHTYFTQKLTMRSF